MWRLALSFQVALCHGLVDLLLPEKGKDQERGLRRYVYDNAGKEGNLCFQICTENGSGPFPYTAELGPWSIVEIWGCRLAVPVGDKGACTSEERGMGPPAGKYG